MTDPLTRSLERLKDIPDDQPITLTAGIIRNLITLATRRVIPDGWELIILNRTSFFRRVADELIVRMREPGQWEVMNRHAIAFGIIYQNDSVSVLREADERWPVRWRRTAPNRWTRSDGKAITRLTNDHWVISGTAGFGTWLEAKTAMSEVDRIWPL